MAGQIRTFEISLIVIQIGLMCALTKLAMFCASTFGGCNYFALWFVVLVSSLVLANKGFKRSRFIGAEILITAVAYSCLFPLFSIPFYTQTSVEKIDIPKIEVVKRPIINRYYLKTRHGPVWLSTNDIPFRPIYVLRASSSDGFLKNSFVCPSKILTTGCTGFSFYRL